MRPVKNGVAKEGAEILGRLDGPAGAAAAAGPVAAAAAGAAEGAAGPDAEVAGEEGGEGRVGGEGLQLLGFVTSELPRGAPKGRRGGGGAGARGAVEAAALWRLRGLQHAPGSRNRGEVAAFVRNPNSTALRAVRLRLLAEG